MHWFCTWTNSTHVQTVDTRPFFLTFQAKHTSQYTQTHLWSSIIEQASWSSSIVTWDTLTVMRIPRYIISLNHTHTTVVHSGFIATPTHNKLVASLLSSSDHERQTFGTVCHCSHGGRCGDIVCVYPGWRTDGESWTNQGDQCWKSLIYTTGKPKSVN